MRWACLIVLLPACQRAAPPQRSFEVPLTAEATPGDEVVATVDGRPIYSSQIALQARSAGSDKKQALQDLITAEALAGEAARRKLDRDRDALEAARAAAVRRYLHQVFEPSAGPDAIPALTVKRTYNANVNLFDHSEYVDVWHILVQAPADKATAEQKQKARALAEQIQKKARGVTSEAAFKELSTQFSAPEGMLPIRLERVVTARDGWTLTTFSFPAHDQLKKPGDISTVVETSYGYHVIYLIKRIPAVHMSVGEASPQIRAQLLPEFQKSEFLRQADEAAKRHAVVVHPERLPKSHE
jgi:peptidyl-prolyl cis-trans isomerase C